MDLAGRLQPTIPTLRGQYNLRDNGRIPVEDHEGTEGPLGPSWEGGVARDGTGLPEEDEDTWRYWAGATRLQIPRREQKTCCKR